MKNNEGHRERLRQRFLMSGLSGFQDYEILELLLTYVIVRKDCKEIAKELLKKYGDLYTLLQQSNTELRENKYITERIAIFFKVLFSIIEKQLYVKIHNEKITISSNVQLLDYLKFSLLNREIEVFKVLFLNTQNELLKEEELFKGTIDRSTVYIRELIKKILNYNAKSVILVHNHPAGSLKPSQSDIILTKKIKEIFEGIEIRLLDHIIISEKGYFSFFLINESQNFQKGDHVIVDTIRGEQIGIVLGIANKAGMESDTNDEVRIREVKRRLTEKEVAKLKELDIKADEAYFKCKKIVKDILPEMNLVIGEYTFDENKLIFYFTADTRLDFRELVKEVNRTFKKRVEFYQIKQNDEGRILSAFGRYGKEIYW